MKCSAYVALAFICASVTAARSEDGSGGNVGVGGEAPPTCALQSLPRQLSANNMSLSATSANSGELLVDQLIDQVTGRLQPASIHIEILGLCNGPHFISVSTSNGGLRPAQEITVVSGAFIRHINYRVNLSWAGQTETLQTDGVPGKSAEAGVVAGPNQGPLGLQLIIDGTGNDMNSPATAGVYSDLVTIQIGHPL